MSASVRNERKVVADFLRGSRIYGIWVFDDGFDGLDAGDVRARVDGNGGSGRGPETRTKRNR